MLYGCFSLTATSVCISQSAVSSTCQNCTTILAMKHFSNGVATYLNVVINTYEISHIWVHVITHQMELELLWLLVPDLPLNKQVSLTWSSITLGHMMSLPIVGGTSDQRSTWPKGEVISHVATRCLFLWGYIWPLVNLTKVVSHLATRCLCLGEGQLDILLDSESATISRPTSHVQKCQPVRVGHIVGGGRTGGARPHWSPVQGPMPPTGSPWGSDLPDQGQASDTNELCSPLYTIGTTYSYCLQFVSMPPNHILLHHM